MWFVLPHQYHCISSPKISHPISPDIGNSQIFLGHWTTNIVQSASVSNHGQASFGLNLSHSLHDLPHLIGHVEVLPRGVWLGHLQVCQNHRWRDGCWLGKYTFKYILIDWWLFGPMPNDKKNDSCIVLAVNTINYIQIWSETTLQGGLSYPMKTKCCAVW